MSPNTPPQVILYRLIKAFGHFQGETLDALDVADRVPRSALEDAVVLLTALADFSKQPLCSRIKTTLHSESI